MHKTRNNDEAAVSARSVIASVLLPLRKPELPAQTLVRCGELFGIAGGTSRVALSRMVANGELQTTRGVYRLSGPLEQRRERQEEGRHPSLAPFQGNWWVAVVTAEGRSAQERAMLRKSLSRLRMGELREGVWARPDNLYRWDAHLRSAGPAPAQCEWFSARPAELESDSGDDARSSASLAGRLWDLDGWAKTARALADGLASFVPRLEGGDTEALAPGFRVAAEVVRHLTADPLLPQELLPGDWPGDSLRHDYDRYEMLYQRLLRDAVDG